MKSADQDPLTHVLQFLFYRSGSTEVANTVFCTSLLQDMHGVQEMGKDIHEVTNVDLLPCAGLHGGS